MAIKRLEAAVDQFAEAMKAKLRKKASAGWSGWDEMRPEDFVECARNHLSRVELGDPRPQRAVQGNRGQLL